MVAILIIAVVALFVFMYLYDQDKTKREDEEMEDFSYESSLVAWEPLNEDDNEDDDLTTDDFLEVLTPEERDNHARIFRVLQAIGCKPVSEEFGYIRVQYRGETFMMHPNGAYFVDIYDLSWSTINAYDPELSLLKEAINRTNWNGPLKIMLQEFSDNGRLDISTSYLMWLYPGSEGNEDYMRAVLNMFFDCKDKLQDTFLYMSNRQQSMN